MNTIDDAERLAKYLSQTRYNNNISQERMAMALHVSKNTVAAYEKGTSSPDFWQILEWYKICGQNPTPDLFKLINPEFDKEQCNDEEISRAADILVSSLSDHKKRCVNYLLAGCNGDPYAMIDLFVAYAHLPMYYRFGIANFIFETFKLCQSVDWLKDTDKIMPNIELLEDAILLGREAAVNGKDNYVN